LEQQDVDWLVLYTALMLTAALRHEHPVAMAHRGSRTLWPENTMMAFRGAVELGYRYLETDLHMSSDGRLVTFHDDTLDRNTDATGSVSKRTIAELKEVDAAYRFDPVHHFPHRGTGVQIPTLREVVEAFPSCIFTLDMKQPGLEAALANEIVDLGISDQVIVGSFKDRRTRRFRKLVGPGVATSSAMWETARLLLTAKAGYPVNIKADALQVPVRMKGITVVNQKLVNGAHARGKQVHVWTVNDPDFMTELLDMGVDGIITDRPDLLADLMTERGEGGPWN
jgi:glycerophosphoryl diester phosphodiesterase